MKKLLITLSVLSLMVFITSYLQGQDQFLLHLGGAFPVGDFGSEDQNSSESGGANIGVNFGFKYVHQLKDAVGFVIGTDLSIHGLKPQVKDDAKALLIANGIQNPEIDFYEYLNIPVSAGLNLKTSINEMTVLYFDACLAMNFLKLTEMEVEANKKTARTNFDWATHLGYKLGVGLMVSDKIDISANYFSLGIHDLKGTTSSGSKTEDIDGEIKVDFVTVTIGLIF